MRKTIDELIQELREVLGVSQMLAHAIVRTKIQEYIDEIKRKKWEEMQIRKKFEDFRRRT